MSCTLLRGQSVEAIESYPSHSDTVFVLSKELLRKADAESDTLRSAQAHFLMGRYFFEGGSFERAVDEYLLAERLIDQTGAMEWRGKIKGHIGTAFHYASDTVSSLSHLREALSIFESLGDKKGIADVCGRLGHYYEKRENYERAKNYQKKALGIYRASGDSSGIATILENIGSIYEDEGEYAKALTYFEDALAHLKADQNFYRLANVYNNIGDSYRKQGIYDSAMVYSRKALEVARQNENLYLEKSAFRDLGKTYVAMEKYDSAFAYTEAAYLAYDDLFGLEVARQIAKSSVVYETEKKEAQLKLKNSEIAFLEKEKALSESLQYTFGGAFVIVLGVGLWVFRLQRQKMRNNKLIFKQREDIYKAEDALQKQRLNNASLKEAKLRTELENKKLREIYLNDQLELRSNELTSQTLKIIRKNKLLDELRKKIDAGSGDKNKRELQKTINSHIRTDKNWESFQELFEKVHEDFYRRLMARAPDLSPAEIRLCCLLKLNLPSKDIAAMLSISPDSLRVSRYRLRKKLQLEGKQKLSKYVIEL